MITHCDSDQFHGARVFRAPTSLALAALVFVAACGSKSEPSDAGLTAADAAPAGAPVDASHLEDAGVAQDASAAPDVGTAPDASPAPVQVTLVTTLGTIDIELNPTLAPIGAANFLGYLDKQFYDGTLFHRVIADFMIQGGGFTQSWDEKPTDAPIKNEAGNGLKNVRGSVAWARTSVVDSATSQFFINVVDNPFLDHKDDTVDGYGYAVFGTVVSGMDVADAIAAVKTDRNNAPVTDVLITTARRKTQ